MGDDQIVPLAQDSAPLLGSQRPPRGPRRVGCRDGLAGFADPHVGHGGEPRAGGRVADRDGGPRRCGNPGAIDERLFAEELWIAQLHGHESFFSQVGGESTGIGFDHARAGPPPSVIRFGGL